MIPRRAALIQSRSKERLIEERLIKETNGKNKTQPTLLHYKLGGFQRATALTALKNRKAFLKEHVEQSPSPALAVTHFPDHDK